MAGKRERDQVSKLLKLLRTVGSATGHKDLSLHSMNVLFTAAQADYQGDPLESREIAERVGISTSAVSRAIGMLGDHGRGGRSLGLLDAKPDLNDRRRKPITLTFKGRKALESILKEV